VRLVRFCMAVGAAAGALALLVATAALGAGNVMAAQEPIGGGERVASATTVVTLTATISPTVPLEDGTGEFYCGDLELAGELDLQVVDVEVEVAMQHGWAGDLVFRLASPDGPYVTMLDRPGLPATLNGDNSNLLPSAPLTFADHFADDAETMGDTLEDAEVICRDDGRCSYFPNRDEDAGSLPNFAGLAGSAAVGSWQFCASDNGDGDAGVLHRVRLRVVADVPPPWFDVFLPALRK
jgi:subtilisin-like proprotein convertase family protein